MFKKLFKILFSVILLCFVCGFSDIKQNDEYSCAPVCAANCIINYNNFDNNNLVEYFSKEAKTSTKGTKANNLCKALDKYFILHKRQAYIKYYGIRPVDKKFRSDKVLNIFDEITNGKSVILNIGVYEQHGKVLNRKYGHYVNAVNIDENGKILVTDPYAKEPYFIEIKDYKLNSKIKHNKDDNERVCRKKYDYKEITNVPYLENNEKALLNGIISIHLIYF